MDSNNEDEALREFAQAKYMALETFRKNGVAVRTPTFFALSNDVIYMSTTTNTGKFKRLQKNAKVRIVPSDFRGNPRGKWLEGIASPVEDPELIVWINEQLDKSHPILRRLRAFMERFSNGKRVAFSIRLGQ